MKEPSARSLVLDSQALSLLLRNDRQVITRIEAARRVGVPVLVSALTVVEAVHGKTDTARLRRLLSRLQVRDVAQADSLTAVQLLSDAGGLHGHKYAIDALVAAMALRSPAPVLVLTSDRDDWSKLCGDQVQIKDVRQ
ncbi:PIN domain-containing protein [Streptomyces fradiae]|uniref:PIN domain-containing protein n=1 Tax=Streptomyces fradiae TaxID=1906 RepID=UPI003690F62A